MIDDAEQRSNKGNDQRARAVAPAKRKRKLAEVIAHEIERDIVGRGWPVGEMIGSQADLIDRYGVSRAVLRESIRLLEHHGIARMRGGPGGGLIVTGPQADAITRSMALYLEYVGVSEQQLVETRKVIELHAVESTTAQITEAGIESLREQLRLERESPAEEHPQLQRDLHTAIAQLSGNPVLALFVTVLNELVEARAAGLMHRAHEMTDEVHDAHARIVDAITSGDVSLARHRMMRHLDAFGERLT